MAIACLCARPLLAQRITGTVREANSSAPVTGAVVWIGNARDSSLLRTLTDERGRFVVGRPPGATVAHVVRIGFLPREVNLTTSDTLPDIELARIPQLAAIATTEQRNCRDDGLNAQTFALWEQARAALLAGAVARETHPARLRLIASDRTLDPIGHVTKHGSSTHEIAANRSYVAGRSPVAFAVYGYMSEDSHERTLYAPDDETLLHPTFLEHHCLSLRGGDVTHRDQIGIAFEPTSTDLDSLVDVRGVLWLDRVKPALRSLSFSYVGLEPAARESGGDVQFSTAPNGAQFISSWTIRTAVISVEIAPADRFRRPPPRDRRTSARMISSREISGEVANARWSDGTEWNSTIPRIIGQLIDPEGHMVPGARVWITDTPDTVTTDAEGRFALPSMPVGLYLLVASDSVLARMGIARTPVTHVLLGSGENTDVRVPFHSRADILERICVGQRYTFGQGVVLGRVVDTKGVVVPSARIELWRRIVSNKIELFREEIAGDAGEDGGFIICGTARDQLLRLRATKEDSSVETMIDAKDEVSVVMLTLRPAP